MAKTIWKYDVGLMAMPGTYEIPRGAEFLAIHSLGYDSASVWFLVNPENEMEKRRFKIYGTGREIPAHAKYLGTFQSPPFVWHLFEETSI